jgi:hypothetical protein
MSETYIIIGAPNVDFLPCLGALRKGKLVLQTGDAAEIAVRLVPLLLVDERLIQALVRECFVSRRGGRDNDIGDCA